MTEDQYAYSADIDVYTRDIDTGNHVNNAAFVEYLEQARLEYLDELVEYSENKTYIVVATLEMEFKRPVTWQDTVTVDLRILDLDTSSFRIEYRLRVDDTVVAIAETVMITYDREAAESIPIPSTWRDRIEADNDQFIEESNS